jgi:hypothetical protein
MASKKNKNRSRRAPARKSAHVAQAAPAALPAGYKLVRNCTADDWTLLARAEHAQRMLTSTLGPHHPLTLGLAQERNITSADGRGIVNVTTLRRALARVFDRTPAEVRYAYHGWEPQREWWTKQDVIDEWKASAEYPGPFLDVSLCGGAPCPAAGIAYEQAGSFDEVRVLIQEGTDKTTAIRQLLRILAFVEQTWEQLIVEPEITARVFSMSSDPNAGEKDGGR